MSLYKLLHTSDRHLPTPPSFPSQRPRLRPSPLTLPPLPSFNAHTRSPTLALHSPPPQALGNVRCYWALLTPVYTSGGTGGPGPSGTGAQLELKFVYLDPVLASHLGGQHGAMLDRGVIEFIHPGEREQARNDLANTIKSDDLQGSVTRMRFMRLSRIKSVLGCPPQENKVPVDLSAVAEDDEYIILDLVLNWAADGLLLAFFHAIKDKDPAANNDPNRQREGWSNYCGTSPMTDDQIRSLHQSIASTVALPPRTRCPPMRVFQLHAAPTPQHTNTLLFTWPPPRPSATPVPFDGLYDAEEYAALMGTVSMDPNQLAAKPGEARTNCTTRFGAEHSIRTEGIYRHITSVFIPHDSVIFACFQITKLYELPATSVTTAAAPPVPPPISTAPPPAVANDWGQPQHPQHPQQHSPVTPGMVHGGSRDWRGGPEYDHPGYSQSPVTPHYPLGAAEYAQAQAHPHAHHYYDPQSQYRVGHVPPPPPTSSGRSGSSTRPLVRPPGDVEKCRSCGTRESPEWRKGENGVKDLCNACGLKLARQVAKREGRQKPRKKDKV